ncbi:hypothetical protein GTE46_005651 [Salmonella enterica subsp. enterica]|nr:hypothetical protein [Salmonella enterica subsp. enterica]EDY2804083.1 hypothetical protein [Salmonella enterica subsp. enterica]
MGKLTTDGLTMNQLAECNAEYVMTIAELEEKCAAMTAKLSMINDLMEAAEQVNKLAQEAAEKLVQECNALAVENAALMAAKEIIRHLNVNREEANFCGIDDCYIDDAVAAMITPATDAFLAEVRASAQSEVIEWLDAEITAIDTMYRGDPSYERDAYWMKSNVLDVVELARKAFVAQLRKGAVL